MVDLGYGDTALANKEEGGLYRDRSMTRAYLI
jgi:hypothetical protein